MTKQRRNRQEDRALQITVVPTVFIGLGGTGQRVLHMLREGFAQRVGTADLPFFRYLYVDTDTTSLSQALAGLHGPAQEWSSTNLIEPSGDTIKRLVTPSADPNGEVRRKLDIDSWFDPEALQQLGALNYAQGVGGRRMFSRLGFLASKNLPDLEQKLIAFYDQLIHSDTLIGRRLEGVEPAYLNIVPVQVEERVRIVVVSSSGGGTGSGSFIDLGYFIRRLAERNQWHRLRQIGHLALARNNAAGSITMNQIRNTAGLLTELDHYAEVTNQRYKASYLQLAGGSSWEDSGASPPYDCTYVVTPQQSDRPLDKTGDLDALLWRMADYLLIDSIYNFPDSVSKEHVKHPRLGPVGAEAFQGDIGQNPRGLQTYGVSRREWPALLIHRALYAHRIAQLAERWGKLDEGRARAAADQLRAPLGLPDDNTQTNRTARSLRSDKLKDALLEQVNGLDPLAQLERSRNLAFDEKQRYRSDKLPDVLNAIRRQFEPASGRPSSSDEVGVVRRIVRSNLEELSNPGHARGLLGVIGTGLLREAFHAEGGPASAKASAEVLYRVLAAELAYVEECLGDLKVQSPEKAANLESCWRYANDALLSEVLQAKKQLYASLQGKLGNLATRFEWMTRYVREWSERNAFDEKPFGRCPSVTVPPASRDRLQKGAGQVKLDLDRLLAADGPNLRNELAELVRQDLPANDKTNRPTLFQADLPRSRGEVDFSYLQPVERAIFEALLEGAANPYNETVLNLLVEDSAARGVPLPNLAAEAEFLIHYDTGAHDYAKLMFGGSPIHFTEIWQMDQPGVDKYKDAQRDGDRWLDHWKGLGAQKRVRVGDTNASLNSQSVSYLAERCSIISQFIIGYDLPRRQELFGLDRFPAISDNRIRMPLSSEALARARQLYLGLILLGQTVYLGAQKAAHRYDYTDFDTQGNPRQRSHFLVQDFPTAQRDLGERTELMHLMEQRLREYLRENSGAAGSAIAAALTSIDEQLRQPNKSWADLLQYNLYNLPLEATGQALYEFAERFGIQLPKEQHPYAVLLARGDDLPGGGLANQDGYYCKKCGQPLGVELPPRVGEKASCPRCHYPRSA
jgi:hypothetical protein